MFEAVKGISGEVTDVKPLGETREGKLPKFADNLVNQGNDGLYSNGYEAADMPIAVENLAPSDSEQVSMIASALSGMQELKPEVWQTLTREQRVEVFNQAEQTISGIERRQPPCTIAVKPLEEGLYGYYSNGEIVLNESIVMDNSPEGFKNAMDTIVHEGRHAYQHYNLDVEMIHPNAPEVDAWRLNYELGYENGESGFLDFQHLGFKHYLLQPVEVDARVFAQNVLNAMNI